MSDIDPIISVLRSAESEFRARGVAHLDIVGSVARGEATTDSDVDLVLDIDPRSRFSLIDQVWVKHRAEALLGRRVDVALRRALRPAVKSAMMRDAVTAFGGEGAGPD